MKLICFWQVYYLGVYVVGFFNWVIKIKIGFMGIVVLGIAIADLVTQAQVEDLKRQINDIVNQHKQISDKLTQISQNLQKLSLQHPSQNLSKMNQNLTQNLRTILTDQQIKLDILKNIDPSKTGVDPQTLLQGILSVLNFVSAVFSIVGVMCATNPATVAVSGVMAVLNSILGIFGLVDNIKQISELNQQKATLQLYFKPGGQFDQNKKSVTTLAFQVIQNFYMVVVNFRSILNELSINIRLLSLSKNSTQLNYKTYLDILQSNPFDDQFQQHCLQTYKNFISIQNSQLDQKVNMSCKYLEDFENSNDVFGRLDKMSEIAGNFGTTSVIGQELGTVSDSVRRLTTLKTSFEGQFEKRKSQTKEDLLNSDKELLVDLMDSAKNMDQQQLSVVEVVSFYTTEFYGDDPSGQTLFQMDLKQIYQSTQFLNYLGVNSRNQNVIILPRPTDSNLAIQWDSNQASLQQLYYTKNPTAKYIIKNQYIRIQVSQFQINNDTKSRLIYFYGMTIRNSGEAIDDCIQMEPSHVALAQFKLKMVLKSIPAQVRVEEDENLETLCKSVCFFINGIAYPERVVNFNISKVDNKYKAVVEWRNQTVKPKFFGKFIKFDIQEGHEMPEEDKVLYSSKVGSNNWVVLRIK